MFRAGCKQACFGGGSTQTDTVVGQLLTCRTQFFMGGRGATHPSQQFHATMQLWRRSFLCGCTLPLTRRLWCHLAAWCWQWANWLVFFVALPWKQSLGFPEQGRMTKALTICHPPPQKPPPHPDPEKVQWFRDSFVAVQLCLRDCVSQEVSIDVWRNRWETQESNVDGLRTCD